MNVGRRTRLPSDIFFCGLLCLFPALYDLVFDLCTLISCTTPARLWKTADELELELRCIQPYFCVSWALRRSKKGLATVPAGNIARSTQLKKVYKQNFIPVATN